MIATINPETAHTEESLSTCRFAQRVSLIKNSAAINEEVDPSMIIRRLKGEVLNLREESYKAEAKKKSEDDDVNEDILAFYQAKEELLKRRNNNS
eukprot:gene27335-36095_t